jgi:thiamine-phosphate pyrophosphorylase
MSTSLAHVLSGLYFILDPSISPTRPLNDALRQSAQAGVKIVQYRNKTASMKEAYAEALPLRKLAAELGVLFIVNDRCDLALAVDADGVHLGQGDLPLDLARKVMGPDKLIGISTHNLDQVREASTGMPDYLGFGPIFKPGSKQDHDPVVGIDGLRGIRTLTSLPISHRQSASSLRRCQHQLRKLHHLTIRRQFFYGPFKPPINASPVGEWPNHRRPGRLSQQLESGTLLSSCHGRPRLNCPVQHQGKDRDLTLA